MASILEQQNRGRGVQVAPGVLRQLPPAPTRRTATRARPRTTLDSIIAEGFRSPTERAAASVMGGENWMEQGLGFVLGNPVTQGILYPLNYLGMAGRGITAGVQAAAEALPDNVERMLPPLPGGFIQAVDERRSREDDRSVWEKMNDPTYGYGSLAYESGNKWLDRGVGFAGDVALDPLTYVTAGAVKSATVPGRLGRLNYAAQVARNVGDEALVKKVARYGPGVLKDEDIVRAGLQRFNNLPLPEGTPQHIIDAAADAGRLPQQGLRFAGMRIPGTGGLARGVNRGFAQARDVINRAPGMRDVTRARLPEGIEKEAELLLYGGGKPGDALAAATAIDINQGARIGAQTFMGLFAEEMKNLSRGMRGDEPQTLTRVAEAEGGTWANDMLEKMAEVAETFGVKVPRRYTSGPGGKRQWYIPHVWTHEGRAWIRGNSPEAQRFREWFNIDIDDVDEASGATLQRKIVARDSPYIIGGQKGPDGKYIKGTGRELNIGSGSIDEINAGMAAAFPEAGIEKFLDDNITSIMANYATRLAADVGIVYAGRRLLDTATGLIRRDTDPSVIRQVLADKGVLKAANDEEAARLGLALRKMEGTADILRSETGQGLTAMSGVLGETVQRALDEVESLRPAVVKTLKELTKNEPKLARESDKVFGLLKSERQSIDRRMADINTKLDELENASLHELDALEWMKPALREARGSGRRTARKKLIRRLQDEQERLAYDHEILTILEERLRVLTRKEDILGRGVRGELRTRQFRDDVPVEQLTDEQIAERQAILNAEREGPMFPGRPERGVGWAEDQVTTDDFAAKWGGEPRTVPEHPVQKYTGRYVKGEDGVWRLEPKRRYYRSDPRVRGKDPYQINQQFDRRRQLLEEQYERESLGSITADPVEAAARVREAEATLTRLESQLQIAKAVLDSAPTTSGRSRGGIERRLRRVRDVIKTFKDEEEYDVLARARGFKLKRRTVSRETYEKAVAEEKALQAELANLRAGLSQRTVADRRRAAQRNVERLQREVEQARAQLDSMHQHAAEVQRRADAMPSQQVHEQRLASLEAERQRRLRASRPEEWTPIMGTMPELGEGAAGRVPLRQAGDIEREIREVAQEQADWTPPKVITNKDKSVRRTPKNLQAKQVSDAVHTSSLDYSGSMDLRARAERMLDDLDRARAQTQELADQDRLDRAVHQQVMRAQAAVRDARAAFVELPAETTRKRLDESVRTAQRVADFVGRYSAAMQAGVEPSEGLSRYIMLQVLDTEDRRLNEQMRSIRFGRLNRKGERVYPEVVDDEVEQYVETFSALLEDVSNASNDLRWARVLTNIQELTPGERIEHLGRRIEINEAWQAERRQRLRNLQKRRNYAERHPESQARGGGFEVSQRTKDLDNEIARRQAIVSTYEMQQVVFRREQELGRSLRRHEDAEWIDAATLRKDISPEEYRQAKESLPRLRAERDEFERTQAKRDMTREVHRDLRRDLRAGIISIGDVLNSDDPLVRSMQVNQVLMALKGTGRAKTERIMGLIRAKPNARVRSLGDGQKELLAELLGAEGFEVAAKAPTGTALYEVDRAKRLQAEISRLRRDIDGADQAIAKMKQMRDEVEITGISDRMAAVGALFEGRTGRPFTEDEKAILQLALGEDRAEVLNRWMWEFTTEHGESAPQVAFEMLMDMLPAADRERLAGLAWDFADQPESVARFVFGEQAAWDLDNLDEIAGGVRARAPRDYTQAQIDEAEYRRMERRADSRERARPRLQSQADLMYLMRGYAIMMARDAEAEAIAAARDTFRTLGFRRGQRFYSDEELARMTADEQRRIGSATEGWLRSFGYTGERIDKTKLRRAIEYKVHRDRSKGGRMLVEDIRARKLRELDWQRQRIQSQKRALGRPRRGVAMPEPYRREKIPKRKAVRGETPEQRAERVEFNRQVERQNNAISKRTNIRWQRRAAAAEATPSRVPAEEAIEDVTSFMVPDPMGGRTKTGRPKMKLQRARVEGGRARLHVIASPESRVSMDWRVPLGIGGSVDSLSRGSVNSKLHALAQQKRTFIEAEEAMKERLEQIASGRAATQQQIAAVNQEATQAQQMLDVGAQSLEDNSGSLVKDVEAIQGRVRSRLDDGRRAAHDDVMRLSIESLQAQDELTRRLRDVDTKLDETRLAIHEYSAEKEVLQARNASLKADLKVVQRAHPRSGPEMLKYIDDLDRIAVAHLDDASPEVAMVHSLLQDAARKAIDLADLDATAADVRAMVAAAKKGTLLKVMVTELDRHWRQMAKELTPEGQGMVFNEVLGPSMKRLRQHIETGKLGRVVEAYTDFFKTYAVARPGFHIRNGLSAGFMNTADGVEAKYNFEAIAMYKRMTEAPLKFWNDPKTTDRERAALMAMWGSGAGGQFTERGVGPRITRSSHIFNNWWTRTSKKLGVWVEGPARLAMALDSIDKGASIDMARARIARIHFDYGEVSRFDRQMKRIIPFWTFMSRNLPMQVQMMWTRPRAYMIAQHAFNNWAEAPDPLMPDYWNEQGAFNSGMTAGGDPLYLAPDLPHTRVLEDVRKLSEPARLVSNINPLFRVPAEVLVSKEKFFSGQQIDPNSYQPLDRELLPLAPLFAFFGQVAQGRSGQYGVTDQAAYAAHELLPPLKEFARMFPGEDKSDEFNADRQAQTLLRWLGVPAYQLSETAKQSELRRRRGQVQRARSREANLAKL